MSATIEQKDRFIYELEELASASRELSGLADPSSYVQEGQPMDVRLLEAAEPVLDEVVTTVMSLNGYWVRRYKQDTRFTKHYVEDTQAGRSIRGILGDVATIELPEPTLCLRFDPFVRHSDSSWPAHFRVIRQTRRARQALGRTERMVAGRSIYVRYDHLVPGMTSFVDQPSAAEQVIRRQITATRY